MGASQPPGRGSTHDSKPTRVCLKIGIGPLKCQHDNAWQRLPFGFPLQPRGNGYPLKNKTKYGMFRCGRLGAPQLSELGQVHRSAQVDSNDGPCHLRLALRTQKRHGLILLHIWMCFLAGNSLLDMVLVGTHAGQFLQR